RGNASGTCMDRLAANSRACRILWRAANAWLYRRVITEGGKSRVSRQGRRSFDGGPRMEVPCPVLLEGPWSPVGYQVVEVAEKTNPATEPGPRPGRCPEEAAPWSAAGYKVVEVKERPPAPPARAPQPATRPKRRPLLRWGAVAAGSTLVLAVAVGLVMGRQPA